MGDTSNFASEDCFICINIFVFKCETALESTSWTNMQYYLSYIPWWLAGMHYLSHEIKYCKKQELSIVSPIIRPNSGLAYHPPYSLEA